MIRAFCYTVLFCGASTGAALSLAYVHDFASGEAQPFPGSANSSNPVPPLVQESAGLRLPKTTSDTAPTFRVAPVVTHPTVAEELLPDVTAPVAPASQTATIAALPKTRPMSIGRTVVGVSTQASVDIPEALATLPRSHSGSSTTTSATLATQGSVGAIPDFSQSWYTGVYR